MDELWRQLYESVFLIYHSYPGDFFVLHFITWLFSLENILNQLSSEQEQRYAIQCFWQGMMAVIFVRSKFFKGGVFFESYSHDRWLHRHA